MYEHALESKLNLLFKQASDTADKGDYKQAFELFLKGAMLNDRSCQHNVGYFYDTGLYVKKDKSKALKWYYKACRQGDSVSPVNIAIIYQEMKEWKKAIWWFHKAVSMGNKDGLFHLGSLYHKGKGVKRNIKTAIKY